MDGKLLSRLTTRHADNYEGDSMKRTAFFTFAIALLCIFPVFSETFRFNFTKGEKYRIVTTVDEKVFVNGEFSHASNFLNKIAVSVIEAGENFGRISASFQVSERTSTAEDSFVMNEEYASEFNQDPFGKQTVAPKYLFPIIRSIPTFPNEDIKPGHTWTAPAQEVHDLRDYGITAPYTVNISIQYTYVGKTVVDNRSLDQFKIEYSYFHKSRFRPSPREDLYPIAMAGEVTMMYYWDSKIGRVAEYDDEFDIFYFMSTGDEIEFVGKSHGDLIASATMNREETRKAIQDQIQRQQLPDVKVESVDQGVKITLDNIQFEPDSDVITAAERQKLNRIADILKQYPGRDLAVIGHAARWGTEKAQMELSISRAKSVANYLLQRGVRDATQMTTIGKGATEPVADNSTEAGRIKNRRVEIILLEN